MTPQRAYSCDKRACLLAGLQTASAVVAHLHAKELEAVATSTNTVELAAIKAEIQTVRERWAALLAALDKHMAEHGC